MRQSGCTATYSIGLGAPKWSDISKRSTASTRHGWVTHVTSYGQLLTDTTPDGETDSTA